MVLKHCPALENSLIRRFMDSPLWNVQLSTIGILLVTQQHRQIASEDCFFLFNRVLKFNQGIVPALNN